MTKRETILKAISGAAATDDAPTINYLLETINGSDRRGLHNNLKAAIDDGLLTRSKDEITGMPCYSLTKAGKDRLAAGPGKLLTPRKIAAKPQSVSWDATTEVSAPETIVDGGKNEADSKLAADTVVEQLPQDESLAVAGSNVALQYHLGDHLGEVCFDAVKRAQAMQERAERAEADLKSTLSANRKFCGYVAELVGNTKYPINLYECQNIISEMIGDMIEDSAAIIATKDARIALLEGNAALPLENAPETTSTAVVKEYLTTQPDETASREFSHYFRDVRHLSTIDIYRVLDLFDVTDHSAGHAIKKLIAAGKRGAKDAERDYIEAAKSIARKLEMMSEDSMKAESLAMASA